MADGVIVGSAVIKVMEQYLGNKDMVEQIGRFVEELNSAAKRGSWEFSTIYLLYAN